MDKGSLSLLGPSVHTYWVIRPNYERKVRFPFMLLNKSQPRPPRISQHQQRAGDLQIKHSYYLCSPVPLNGIAAHMRAWRGRRWRVYSLWYGASKFFFFFLKQKGGGSPVCILCLVPVSCDQHLPTWAAPLSNSAIHKLEQGGRDMLITGMYYRSFIMLQLHRSHYGGMGSQDPMLWYPSNQIWDPSCVMKTQSKLHITQELHSRYAFQWNTNNYDLSN